ncbi:PAS/PAC and GAF sensor-containing diguanylate cyclase/phosphodiesterase [Salinisphaera dokdonensis CL-ES53]|uniref:PAS/PAC and GAF sensor-containing diguanylate cyclase/phosphodiesterase n=2 Tax=Salinisphaera TaxID=180541 RepID=A0ABV2B418_9GAMM
MVGTQRQASVSEKALCVIDGEGDILFTNLALASLLGIDSTAALIGRSIDAFIECTSIASLIERQYRQGVASEPTRVSLVCAGEARLPALVACYAFRNADGAVDGAALIITRRSLDASSDASRSERLEMALEAGELGAWSLDLRTNAAWRTDLHDRIFGYDNILPEWSYETFLDHVVEADRAHVIQSLAQARETNTAWEFECRIRRVDGMLRWIWAQGRVEQDVQDEPLAMFGVIRDISARKATEEQIEFLAFYDPLTRLPNRRLMLDRLGQAVRSAVRDNASGALFFIDLDDFKTLNDTLGHQAGDQMLLEVARRLMSCLRAQDTVARFGGDEFVVMMEGLGSTEAEVIIAVQQIAEKVLRAIEQPYDFSVLWHRRMTCSIGVATFGSTQDTPDLLLRQADIAMYRAKATGGHAVHFYEPHMQAAIDARVALESEIQIGIQRGEFELFYQPQVDLHGATVAAEALLRWRHPIRGLVEPNDFIPVAESSGLIVQLGTQVITAACHKLQDWADDPELAPISVAVNISARQFRDARFVDDICAVLDATAIEPAKLVLELTESALLECVEETAEHMMELKKRGIRFALDDFGMGYSSLYYLKRLPIDQLKIDQRFVSDVLSDPNDLAIVRTIIALAQCLGLRVVAEGVETQATSGFLLAQKCHLQQGFLFSRPLPAAAYEQFMRERQMSLCIPRSDAAVDQLNS